MEAEIFNNDPVEKDEDVENFTEIDLEWRI